MFDQASWKLTSSVVAGQMSENILLVRRSIIQ